jgi:hypothetical protein
LEESSEITKYDKFKYSETATVNILELNKISGRKIVATEYVDHSSYLDESHIKLNEDGFYTVTQIVLPTLDWAIKILNEDKSYFDYYTNTYVIDGDLIYKWNGEVFILCEIEEVLEMNPEKTTLAKASKDIFVICFLWKCFVDLCKGLLSSNLTKCKSKNSDLDTLQFNRDFIWMTINVLTYYIERNMLYEAERILEEVRGCNGICNQSLKMVSGGKGCGCKG